MLQHPRAQSAYCKTPVVVGSPPYKPVSHNARHGVAASIAQPIVFAAPA